MNDDSKNSFAKIKVNLYNYGLRIEYICDLIVLQMFSSHLDTLQFSVDINILVKVCFRNIKKNNDMLLIITVKKEYLSEILD